MCTVSMIMDHYADRWRTSPPPTFYPWVSPIPTIPTKAEIDEFRKLLERARKYDADHGEPDCELDEKRQRLLDLAEELGIEIDFV